MHSIAWWPIAILVGLATITDLKSRRIPNWLVLPFLVAGIAVSGWQFGWHGVGRSLEGAGLGLLAFGVLFLMGGMGAGDVKLMAAIGAWIGPGQLLIALVLTGLAGGLMVLGWATFGGFIGELLDGTGKVVANLARGEAGGDEMPKISNALGRKMPYAPAIAVGTLLSFFAGK